MINWVNEHIRALNAKQARSPEGTETIRLDKGEFPVEPSPQVISAIADAAATINRYPEILGGSLRGAIAEYTRTKAQQIIIGNGSDDLIELILKVFVKPGEEVLLPIPTFFIYDFATRVVGGKPVAVERTKDFAIDVEVLLKKVTPATKVLFIANPNNPTANLIPRSTILEILNSVECIVVVDECYYEFSQETVVDLIEEYPNLMVLRSFSKSFGLAGMRVGYGIANEIIIDYLYRAAQLFPVNKLALIAAKTALTDITYYRTKIEQIDKEKTNLTTGMQQLGCTVYPSATNFLFVRTETLGITSSDLVQSLRDKNILVADFGLKQGLDAYYFRTAVGTPSENKALLAGLRKVISNK